MKKIIPFLVVIFAPLVTFAQGALTPGCGYEGGPDCSFGYFFLFIQKIVNFVMFTLGIPVAVILFVYAGWLYLVDMGQEKRKSQAKNIFMAVLIGFVIMLGAWLFINFILNFFVDPEFREVPDLIK